MDNNVNSPPGGMCYGYDSFYNFVSPVDGIFCLKCCKGIDACEIFNGEKGCSVMVPGDYSMGFDRNTSMPKTGRFLNASSNITNVTNDNSTLNDSQNGNSSHSNAIGVTFSLTLLSTLTYISFYILV